MYCITHIIHGVCAQLLQSCLTLCDPVDLSPPGSSVHGLSQARTLERGGSPVVQWQRCHSPCAVVWSWILGQGTRCHVLQLRPGAVQRRKEKKERWSGSPCPPAGDLRNPGMSLCLSCLLPWQAGSLHLAPPGRPHAYVTMYKTDS